VRFGGSVRSPLGSWLLEVHHRATEATEDHGAAPGPTKIHHEGTKATKNTKENNN
jgi:hypothetical protein